MEFCKNQRNSHVVEIALKPEMTTVTKRNCWWILIIHSHQQPVANLWTLGAQEPPAGAWQEVKVARRTHAHSERANGAWRACGQQPLLPDLVLWSRAGGQADLEWDLPPRLGLGRLVYQMGFVVAENACVVSACGDHSE